ncbi:MAG: PilZ domain-containing protein [Gammaproteobacteria bacterium]
MSSSSTDTLVEQRRQPRTEVDEPLNVRDAHSGRVLGQLVNVSNEGLMLVSPCPIASGAVHQLQIPVKINAEVRELALAAENLWCHDANDTGAYWSGFQIIGISPENRQLLAALVNA